MDELISYIEPKKVFMDELISYIEPKKVFMHAQTLCMHHPTHIICYYAIYDHRLSFATTIIVYKGSIYTYEWDVFFDTLLLLPVITRSNKNVSKKTSIS